MPGPQNAQGLWISNPEHRAWMRQDALRQYAFFAASKGDGPGFHVLDYAGNPLPDTVQELHTTTRMVHSFALGQIAGLPGADAMVEQGMAYLWSHHRDTDHGGYVWSLDGDKVADGTKMAYGHVFVLLAASSAKLAGHPDADRLLADISDVLETRYWDEDAGLFKDEFTREWEVFSTYRGMNANMHGVEALLGAYEATGEAIYLDRAGRILDFFLYKIAEPEGWRIPEHYHEDWTPDRAYAGNPMFRPAGTTPGHSFEMARLLLQHWDLRGRPDGDAQKVARAVLETALNDAWDREREGFVYTLDFGGTHDNRARYWWPVTEAIGALAMFLKLSPDGEDEARYRKLWAFADTAFVDHKNGGWFPEIDDAGQPAMTQFKGKPDIYHSIQAVLYPMTGGISRHATSLPSLAP